MSTEKGLYMEKPGGKIIYTEPIYGIAFCVKTNFYPSVLRRGEIKCPQGRGTFKVFQITKWHNTD